MDTSKKKLIGKVLVYVFLILYPLGQLIRIDLAPSVGRLTIQPIDVVAALSILLVIIFRVRVSSHFKIMGAFLVAAFFSLALSYAIVPSLPVIVGAPYLIRLASYWALLILANYSFSEAEDKKRLLRTMTVSVFVVALLGWLQYIFISDLRFLALFGWDDHLGRLTSTLLDPGFTSILLVFGSLASLLVYLNNNNKKMYMVLFLFFGITLLFTYSRAGYLAFALGILTVGKIKKNLRLAILTILAFGILVILLPRGEGMGVRLERTYSVFSRLQSYYEAVIIWKVSPVFGVGYNNYCAYKGALFSHSLVSHSCSGSDSSLLLVLATTGVVGVSILLGILIKLARSVNSNIYGQLFITSFVSLLVHSLFVNSLFYPWVLGWMVLLLAISVKE